ncbi:MAG: acetyl-CoA carboxylase biotin carboxylase subunit [Alphaproteobacteria bacterium]|nr:acetyl-CoA carboxylase biotin carboxylase subunit [Alphaproteobacteria bacterium]
MFHKILIANRGEIACRVIRTARRLGIATVAVYSEADAGTLHVAMADEAVAIGAPAPRASYLNIAAILAAARDSGVEAVHPGYGFLSENADFAEACAAAGLVFIGPPPAAMRAMGSKAAAKALMQRHGVPVVPGYHGDDLDADRLAAEAERIGYPVMIKASAGGGGRGLRVVPEEAEFARALQSAKREAAGAFGDDRVLLERYLERPRHIEVQVFADRHGNAIHLFERDCSVQRRHQKVIEEAPGPGLDPDRRQAFGAAAVAAAQAVGYVGAGTVEFIVPGAAAQAGNDFYFMEMNTRLQVEHPVTEAITGLDLVEWQFRVAAGEELPLTQERVALSGHAIEARLYAENPERGFLPATGRLHRLRLPSPEVARVDTGVREGDTVTPFYDPLIAKIVVHGEDRAAALARLSRALADSAVLGPATNLAFLGRVAANPEFRAGAVDTGFIERQRPALLPEAEPPPDPALAAAALHVLQRRATATAETARLGTDRFSPWAASDGWRLNRVAAPQSLLLRCGDGEWRIEATPAGDVWELVWQSDNGEIRHFAGLRPRPDDRCRLRLDGHDVTAVLLDDEGALVVAITAESWRFNEGDPLAPPAAAENAIGRLSAPMPGRVVQRLAEPGDAVRRGQPVMVIEAMKMEHTIAAPRDGVVATVRFAVGDLVEEGAELIALRPVGEGA